MLGWSLKLFRIAGIQVAVHVSFLILLLPVAYDGWRLGGWEGASVNVLTLCTLFACVLLHEFGHSFTAMGFGIGVRRILLMPIGGMAEFDSIPRQPIREFLITIAGPAVNFVIAGGLALFIDEPPGWRLRNAFDAEYAATLTGFLQLVLAWNLIMGLFNLLPVFPMDGGRIFRALLATRMRYLKATWVAATVAKVLATIAAAAALVIWDRPLTAALFAFIFFAGEVEYRAVKRREQEDAQWRSVLARIYAYEPPAEEPPLLRR